MSKVKPEDHGDHVTYMIECPGCAMAHEIDDRWTFNGDIETPTFAPSLKVTWTYGEDEVAMCCHSFIENGYIRFLDDCTHNLAGQTVELPDFDRW